MVSQPIVFREQEMRQNLGIMQGHKVPLGADVSIITVTVTYG